MRTVCCAAVLFAACSMTLSAQTAVPAKDAASTQNPGPLIVDARPAPYRGMIYPDINLGHGRFDYRNGSVLDLVTWAFDRYDYAVLGGPTWVDLDRFDVIAKVDTPPPPKPDANPGAAPAAFINPYDATRPILQRALVERFHLKYHTEERPMPGYIMSVARDGLKMTPAKDPDAPSNCHGEQDKSTPPVYTVTCTSATVAELVKNYGGVFPHLLVDRTGLTKPYDYTMRMSFGEVRTRDDYVRMYIDIFKQLGLAITQGDVPQPAIVIDSVDRPTPTPPEIARLIPPLPELEFEVATIKPAADNEPQDRVMPRGSQIIFSAFNIQGLLTRAFQLKTGAVLGDALPTLSPKRYTILVKLPPEVDAQSAFRDEDVVDNMLQKLLVDRFGLKYHWGTQARDGWVLMPGTPKMKKADPNSRSFCKYGPPPGEKDVRSSPDSPFDNESYCQNVTMDQFADMTQAVAGVEVKNRVPNKTGLEGSYDFTLYFTSGRKLRTEAAAADAAAKEAGKTNAARWAGSTCRRLSAGNSAYSSSSSPARIPRSYSTTSNRLRPRTNGCRPSTVRQAITNWQATPADTSFRTNRQQRPIQMREE
jgi:uncharacterized protein (TIGR03435 family)